MSELDEILLRLHHIDDIVVEGQEFVDAGVLSEEDYAAIKEAVRDFQDTVARGLRGQTTRGELHDKATAVLTLLRRNW